jgi:hypothetical protein
MGSRTSGFGWNRGIGPGTKGAYASTCSSDARAHPLQSRIHPLSPPGVAPQSGNKTRVGLRGACRVQTSNRRRAPTLVSTRINLEETPVPTKDARVATRGRAYARWSSNPGICPGGLRALVQVAEAAVSRSHALARRQSRARRGREICLDSRGGETSDASLMVEMGVRIMPYLRGEAGVEG